MKAIYILFSFLLSFSISMVVLELFVSTTFIAEQSNNDVYNDIGRGRRAGFEYVKFGEGFSAGQFNEFRYMGPGYPYEKNPGTLRIALLGDSYVEGFQVFDRDHFRRILEDELKGRLNVNVEVLNFGRSGFDLADMYCYNETFVSEFNPDFSLYFVSNADLNPETTDPLRLTLKLEDDSLVISKQFPNSYLQVYNETKWLVQYSSILNMLNNCRKIAKSEGVLPILLDKLYPVLTITQSYGESRFIMPIITSKIVNHFNSGDIIINRDQSKLEDEFIDSLSNNKLLLIDLSDTLQYMKDSGHNPNYWIATKKYGHWNQTGHKAVAKFISDRLLENGVLN